MEVVYDIVCDMRQKGIVKQVEAKLHCVAPLGLVSKSQRWLYQTSTHL